MPQILIAKEFFLLVYDKMQQGYEYELTEPEGQNFSVDF